MKRFKDVLAKEHSYYNENDPYAAQWLRNLVKKGHIVGGEVDPRSIRDISSALECKQAHFFAGIGAWSYALRLAGWPDDAPVWTGSCPCQPFSQAGRRKGTSDERHLWPEWFRLIRTCKPPVIFGEQVANPDGLAWLDAVLHELEGEGYEVGAADLCAAGVGAPHIRQRLYFVAIARGERRRERLRLQLQSRRTQSAGTQATRRGEAGELGDPRSPRSPKRSRSAERLRPLRIQGPSAAQAGAVRGFWADADLIYCRPSKSGRAGEYRPVEPGSFPLAHGAANRVGRVRAYGNAIVPEVAATFIQAVMESI